MRKTKIKALISAVIASAMAVGFLAGCGEQAENPQLTSQGDTQIVGGNDGAGNAVNSDSTTEATSETSAPETVPPQTTTPAVTTAQKAAITTTTTTTAATTQVTTTWTEKPVDEQVMYVSKGGIYSRINAIQGSKKISQYKLNDTVTVVARTNTDYYKLSDGNFIHVSFLDSEKTVTTTAAAAEPAENNAPAENAEPAVTTTLDEETLASFEHFAEKVFELTNQERVNHGLPVFEKRDDLSAIAVQRATELAVLYDRDHLRPNGEKWYQMLYREGMYYGQMGENIAAGQTSPEEMVDAWMNSQVHRDNILSTDYDYLGVGFYYDPDSYYKYHWVQDFYGTYKGD